LGQAQVPFKKEPSATTMNTLVSMPSQPLTILVEAEKK
jgi:hypothetical protein